MKLIIKEEKYDLSWKEHDVKMRVDGEMGTYPSYAKRVGNLVVNIDPEVFNNGEFGYTVYYTPHIGKAGFKKAESGFMNSSEAMDYADTYIFGASDFVDPFWESKSRRNRSTKRMNEMTSDEQKDKLKQLKLREGDLELYSEPEYIGPYGDDGWETDDNDYYNFKQLGLKTVRDVVDFYKDLSKRQIVARRGAYGVLGDIDWNVRHGYWDDRNTQAVLDTLDSDPSFKFYGESLKSKSIRNRSTKRLKEQVEDFEDTKDIVLVKSWLDDNGFDYEYIKSNQSASWFNINGQKRRIPRLEPKKNKVYSYMNNIRSLIESKSRLKEQNVEIEVKNKGILEVPENKNVDDLPLSHFEKLVKKHGLSKITKALNNLQVWNKNDDKKLSKWAGDMIDKLTKKYGKNESVFKGKIKEGWTNKNRIISFRHNDDLEADLEEFLFDVFSENPDVFEFDWQGKNTYLYLNCNEDNYDYIKWFIEDWKDKHRDEYDECVSESVSLKENEMDDWYESIPKQLWDVTKEMEKLGWDSVGYVGEGVEYALGQEDPNRPELNYEIIVDITHPDFNPDPDSIYVGKWIGVYDYDKMKNLSDVPNTSGVTEFRTPQDVRKFTQWFRRLGTSFSTKESIRKNKKQTIDEGVAASLLTIKNQLMNKLGSAFKSIGGSMNPKVTVYREDDPNTSFDITTDGKNVDIVPKYDGIPDTVHKKRGIAFMRAVNVLYDFIMDTLGGKGKLATENIRKRRNRRK